MPKAARSNSKSNQAKKLRIKHKVTGRGTKLWARGLQETPEISNRSPALKPAAVHSIAFPEVCPTLSHSVSKQVHAEEMAKRSKPLVTILAAMKARGFYSPCEVQLRGGTHWLPIQDPDGNRIGGAIPITEAEAIELTRAQKLRSDTAEIQSISNAINVTGKDQPAAWDSVLRAAWTIYASNRPTYEAQTDEHQHRLYASLRKEPLPMTKNLELWWDRSEALEGLDLKASVELNDTASNAVFLLADKIMASKPKSIADLAAMANACAAANDELWDENVEDLEYGPLMVRKLIEGILAAANAQLMLTGLPIPQTINQYAFAKIAEEQREQA